jgi:Predicted Fe-S protein
MTSDDDVWRRDEPDSPCVAICVIHPAERLCLGCGRTPDEITGWAALAPERRRALLAALPERQARLSAASGRPSARRRRRRAAET